MIFLRNSGGSDLAKPSLLSILPNFPDIFLNCVVSAGTPEDFMPVVESTPNNLQTFITNAALISWLVAGELEISARREKLGSDSRMYERACRLVPEERRAQAPSLTRALQSPWSVPPLMQAG
jgi:hypothetical protein